MLAPFFARADGNEVVVVYNSQMPESGAVARHYAQVRGVPANQVYGFPLTTDEVMSRADFTEKLQKPLADRLEKDGLWKFGRVIVYNTNKDPVRVDVRVVASKIRYAVLCYGVPLKIAPDLTLREVEEKLMRSELRRNEAAVDSELAWLPLSRMDIPLAGVLPNFVYGVTNPAALNPTNGILLVARLDGPTADIASHLVDKAMAAETNGLWGRAYFDARGISPSDASYYLGDEWILTGAKICTYLGFDVDTDTNPETFSASYPMDHIAIYAGWYTGDANGPFALPTVEFMPGAFAYHLYSFSAGTLRSSTQNWCGPLLAKGATCTMGCVYEPYLTGTPNIACFLQAFGNGFTFGEAAWAAQPALSWQTTVIGDPLYRPFGKTLTQLHAGLYREHSPLIDWAFDRLVNLDLVRGVPLLNVANYLESVPITAHSALLTERLADMDDHLGKPSSAIDLWQRALRLHPSPQQNIRIRLVLADKLVAADRIADAIVNYKQLLADAPNYPGKASVQQKLQKLEQQPDAVTHH
jgi:uncharacterized protein (TIGR03790 family)